LESPGTIGTTKKRSAKPKNAHVRESILRKTKAFKRVVVMKERSKGCRWVGGVPRRWGPWGEGQRRRERTFWGPHQSEAKKKVKTLAVQADGWGEKTR
jgi:hypothetical protein